MRTLAFTAALLTSFVAFARPPAAFSIGPVLSLPEIFGGQLSYWPDDDVTIDARATLSSVEAGLTGHIGLHSGARQGSLWGNNSDVSRHDLLLTAMGGFVHRGVHSGTYADDGYGHGGRVIGAVGYGYQGGLDVRLEGGLSAYDTAAGWQLDPTFWAFIGFFL